MRHDVSRLAISLRSGPVRTTAVVLAAALLATGCSQSRFGGAGLQAAAPQPLPAAPAGSVQTGALPPPPVTASGPGGIQTTPIGEPEGTQVASADPVAATTSTGGQPITPNALIGNWSTSVAGGSCATFFGLTDLGSGLLGGTRGCAGDLARFRTWKVEGNNATLRDAEGRTVATLTRTGDKSFAGRTSGGESFTLTR